MKLNNRAKAELIDLVAKNIFDLIEECLSESIENELYDYISVDTNDMDEIIDNSKIRQAIFIKTAKLLNEKYLPKTYVYKAQ